MLTEHVGMLLNCSDPIDFSIAFKHASLQRIPGSSTPAHRGLAGLLAVTSRRISGDPIS
jgi:hypothetical protein